MLIHNITSSEQILISLNLFKIQVTNLFWAGTHHNKGIVLKKKQNLFLKDLTSLKIYNL
jgi:hypothetical protein